MATPQNPHRQPGTPDSEEADRADVRRHKRQRPSTEAALGSTLADEVADKTTTTPRPATQEQPQKRRRGRPQKVRNEGHGTRLGEEEEQHIAETTMTDQHTQIAPPSRPPTDDTGSHDTRGLRRRRRRTILDSDSDDADIPQANGNSSNQLLQASLTLDNSIPRPAAEGGGCERNRTAAIGQPFVRRRLVSYFEYLPEQEEERSRYLLELQIPDDVDGSLPPFVVQFSSIKSLVTSMADKEWTGLGQYWNQLLVDQSVEPPDDAVARELHDYLLLLRQQSSSIPPLPAAKAQEQHLFYITFKDESGVLGQVESCLGSLMAKLEDPDENDRGKVMTDIYYFIVPLLVLLLQHYCLLGVEREDTRGEVSLPTHGQFTYHSLKMLDIVVRWLSLLATSLGEQIGSILGDDAHQQRQGISDDLFWAFEQRRTLQGSMHAIKTALREAVDDQQENVRAWEVEQALRKEGFAYSKTALPPTSARKVAERRIKLYTRLQEKEKKKKRRGRRTEALPREASPVAAIATSSTRPAPPARPEGPGLSEEQEHDTDTATGEQDRVLRKLLRDANGWPLGASAYADLKTVGLAQGDDIRQRRRLLEEKARREALADSLTVPSWVPWTADERATLQRALRARGTTQVSDDFFRQHLREINRDCGDMKREAFKLIITTARQYEKDSKDPPGWCRVDLQFGPLNPVERSLLRAGIIKAGPESDVSQVLSDLPLPQIGRGHPEAEPVLQQAFSEIRHEIFGQRKR